MFERYTEKARRVIFFARREASEFGSATIESEHILLGLVQEDVVWEFNWIAGGPVLKGIVVKVVAANSMEGGSAQP